MFAKSWGVTYFCVLLFLNFLSFFFAATFRNKVEAKALEAHASILADAAINAIWAGIGSAVDFDDEPLPVRDVTERVGGSSHKRPAKDPAQGETAEGPRKKSKGLREAEGDGTTPDDEVHILGESEDEHLKRRSAEERQKVADEE